jgi:hypothetical protein
LMADYFVVQCKQRSLFTLWALYVVSLQFLPSYNLIASHVECTMDSINTRHHTAKEADRSATITTGGSRKCRIQHNSPCRRNKKH